MAKCKWKGRINQPEDKPLCYRMTPKPRDSDCHQQDWYPISEYNDLTADTSQNQIPIDILKEM